MKKTNFILALFALVVTFAASSCKKEVSVKELLQDKKWTLTAQTTGGVDSYSSLSACQKDDFSIFNASGTLTADEGATKCDPSAAQSTSTAKWTLSADEKVVTVKEDFSGTTLSIDFTIVELSATKLVFSYKDLFTDSPVVATHTAK